MARRSASDSPQTAAPTVRKHPKLLIVAATVSAIVAGAVHLDVVQTGPADKLAETEAQAALASVGFNWATVNIKNRIAYIRGVAPGEPERLIAYDIVRKTLKRNIGAERLIADLDSELTLADAPPAVAHAEQSATSPVVASLQPAAANVAPSSSPPPQYEAAEPPPVVEPAATPPSPTTADTAAVPPPSAAEASPQTPTPAPPSAVAETPPALPAAPNVAEATPPASQIADAKPERPHFALETAAISPPTTPSVTDCRDEFADLLSETTITFGVDSSVITVGSQPVLDQLAAIARRCADYRLTVEGHSDIVGRAEHNLALSQQRAESVRDALVSRGVAPEKIAAVGYGSSQRIAFGSTDEDHAKNRRIAISVREASAAAEDVTSVQESQPSVAKPAKGKRWRRAVTSESRQKVCSFVASPDNRCE